MPGTGAAFSDFGRRANPVCMHTDHHISREANTLIGCSLRKREPIHGASAFMFEGVTSAMNGLEKPPFRKPGGLAVIIALRRNQIPHDRPIDQKSLPIGGNAYTLIVGDITQIPHLSQQSVTLSLIDRLR